MPNFQKISVLFVLILSINISALFAAPQVEITLLVAGDSGNEFTGSIIDSDAGTSKSISGVTPYTLDIDKHNSVITIHCLNGSGSIALAVTENGHVIKCVDTTANNGSLSITYKPSDKSNTDFRNIKWGINQKQLIAAEKIGEYIEENDLSEEAKGLYEIYYQTSFIGYNKIDLNYGFFDNILTYAGYSGSFSSEDESKAFYNKLIEYLKPYKNPNSGKSKSAWKEGKTYITVSQQQEKDEDGTQIFTVRVIYSNIPAEGISKEYKKRAK